MKRIIDQKATKERIRELRIQRGYTQEEIADIMGGSRSYYNSMETGKKHLLRFLMLIGMKSAFTSSQNMIS